MPEYNLGKVVGTDGNGIKNIEKTETVGLNDVYTITMDDDTEYTFIVTNGKDGESGTDIVTAWESALSDTKVPSEKLVKNTIDTKQAVLVSGTNIKTINNNSILGSGNLDIQGGGSVDIVTSWESTLSDTKVPSEKLTKNTIDGLNIPTKISDLTNDSDFIETSSTSGLIKNDGTIDKNTYVDTDDIANNLTTTASGKVLDARQGKILYDLIAGIEEDMLQ